MPPHPRRLRFQTESPAQRDDRRRVLRELDIVLLSVEAWNVVDGGATPAPARLVDHVRRVAVQLGVALPLRAAMSGSELHDAVILAIDPYLLPPTVLRGNDPDSYAPGAG